MLESQDGELTDLDQRQAHAMAVLLACDIMTRDYGGGPGEATLERLQAIALDILGQMRVPEEGRVELLNKVLTTPLHRYLLPDATPHPLDVLELPWSEAERMGLSASDELLELAVLLRSKGMEPSHIVTSQATYDTLLAAKENPPIQLMGVTLQFFKAGEDVIGYDELEGAHWFVLDEAEDLRETELAGVCSVDVGSQGWHVFTLDCVAGYFGFARDLHFLPDLNAYDPEDIAGYVYSDGFEETLGTGALATLFALGRELLAKAPQPEGFKAIQFLTAWRGKLERMGDGEDDYTFTTTLLGNVYMDETGTDVVDQLPACWNCGSGTVGGMCHYCGFPQEWERCPSCGSDEVRGQTCLDCGHVGGMKG